MKYTRDNRIITGHDWNATVFELTFENYNGWSSKESFYQDKINREEFLSRASNCKIYYDKNQTRREASKLKQKLGIN